MYKNCYQLSQGGGGGPEDDDEDCQTETEKDSKSARRGISQKLSNGAGLAALAFGKFGKMEIKFFYQFMLDPSIVSDESDSWEILANCFYTKIHFASFLEQVKEELLLKHPH